MSKKEIVLIELDKLKAREYQRITMDQLQALLRKCDIIAENQRRDYVMWLEAKEKIKIIGQTIELL